MTSIDPFENYRLWLARAKQENRTGLHDEVYAILKGMGAIVELLEKERLQRGSDWRSQVYLANRVKRLEKSRDE